ncbi:MAG: 30S ribosomal protein S17 [bacterium]|nr:30S ribosomal protein S17 [bacterium]
MTDSSTTSSNNNSATRGRRRVVQGLVSSDKMDQTITVRVERRFKHAKYKKYIRRHEKVHAHDSANDAHIGDIVELMECRPLSKTKRWRLVRVISRAKLEGEV